MSSQFLFVYGTLRSDCHNPHALRLRREATLVGIARMRGRLYKLGRYPGMRPAHDRGAWVWGEIYRLHRPMRTLRALDRYEGAEFRRRTSTAVLRSGRHVRCWAYIYERGDPRNLLINSKLLSLQNTPLKGGG
ncbi:MAG: gamma-glutamylcyclotransferase [Acidobacteria bacterium]|nr:gamma-glutamylcyclotransferase [Acidobacteriota bacterium]